MFINKIEKTEKTIYTILGIKFARKHKNKKMCLYNKNRFYNSIIEKSFPSFVRRGILEDRFYKKVGYFPNLNDPQTFNEKLNWLKLYYHDKLQEKCVDKITFKEYITQVLGGEYVIPTIGIYEHTEDINFSELPEKFVIKSNCGWGGEQVIIVKNRETADFNKIRAQINSWLVPWNNYFYQSFEWDYENIKPKIIIEEYLEAINGDIPDYKLFCYNGKPKVVLVIEDRFKKVKTKKTFLDINWNILPIRRPKCKINEKIEKPENFDEMIKIASKLAEPFPFVRVDFYYLKNKIYIGELTFYPGGGVEPFASKKQDYELGRMLKLPEKKEK